MMAQLFGDNNGGKLLSVIKIPESILTMENNLYFVSYALLLKPSFSQISFWI